MNMDFKIGDEVVLTGEGWRMFQGDIVTLTTRGANGRLGFFPDASGDVLYLLGGDTWSVELYVPDEPGSEYPAMDYGTSDGGSSYGSGEKNRLVREVLGFSALDKAQLMEEVEKKYLLESNNWAGIINSESPDDFEEAVNYSCCDSGECYDYPEENDAINPNHYQFPGGVEVIQISQWLTSNSAQALQYIARSSRIDGKNKGDTVEDLQKAIRFLEQEVERLG